MATTESVTTKTGRRLRKAYCRLFKEVGEDKISVSNLTEEADISRATFYLYYQNIDEFREDAMKYIVSLFIKQSDMFLDAGRTGAQQATKRKNLIFTDNDFDLFYCFFSKNRGFSLDQGIFDYAFTDFNEHVSDFFDKKTLKKNRDRLNLFCIGYASVMRENFLDYHSDKVYRDVLRSFEMWECLFPDKKINF